MTARVCPLQSQIASNHSVVFPISHPTSSEVDEEGNVSWKLMEKHKNHDLTGLENQLGVVLHPSIKEYFNSYWFASLDGFIGKHYIRLEAVLPNIELDSFIYGERLQK
ncbi:MAG: SecY-interacting protein Syd [Thermoactinomyces sp.]